MVKGPAVPTVARWVVLAAVSGNVGIALGAFWLSFTALTNLAGLAGIAPAEAWVWPLIVDGMIVVATISVVALSPHGPRAIVYPWGLLIAGTVVSVAANIAHSWVALDVSVSKPLAACVSAIPPIVLLASTHLTVDLTRRSRGEANVTSVAPVEVTTEASRARPAAPIAVPVTSEPRGIAAELRGAGWSNRRIARELQVHPSTVGRWLAAGLEDVGGAGTSANADEQEARSAQ
jgi:hypothetical protein